MRCYTRVPLGKTGRMETYCYEPLNDKGECPIHGPQWQPIRKQDEKGVVDSAEVSDLFGSADSKS